MSLIYVIVHFDGVINQCPNEGVTFTSPSAKLVHLNRGVTLQRLKKVIHTKLHRDENERVEMIHFCYPIRLDPRVSNYICVQLNDDEDVKALFNIYDSNQLQSSIELYVTFATNVTQVPQLSPYQTFETINPSFPTYDMNYDLQSYTQLHTGGFIDLNEIPSQAIEVEPIEEHAIMGLLTEVFDPLRFLTKEHVQDVINRFHIVNHCTYKVKMLSTTRLVIECVHNDCDWRCRAILLTKEQHWKIMKLEGCHTYVSPLISQDHNNLRSRMISQTIHEIIEADPSTPITTIIAHIKSTMGYTISYRKKWLGKQHAIENIFENWEESYHKLPNMLQAMQCSRFHLEVEYTTGVQGWLVGREKCVLQEKARNMPICSMVMATYTRCNKIFIERGREVDAMINAGHVYSEVATKTIQDAQSKANTHKLSPLTEQALDF
ncbi:uncharacterized protein LOC113874139 [Abrus precatorius]|uniref:Uncharacterized protein LOC113874139 n=1 Tax=Abrus precatorius TaxID=3816 RepID=A0A8B8MJT0_ABRPR|nr:uncharacterized protein LOC113874139 [Abrus precatorius]